MGVYLLRGMDWVFKWECDYCAVRTGSSNGSVITARYELVLQMGVLLLRGTNWVFKWECDYCAVRTGSSNSIQVNFHTDLHLHVALTKVNGRILGTFRQSENAG